MHPILVGTLRVGLLEIPVKVYAAKEEREAATAQLCARCLTPVQLRRWCPACRAELEPEQVVRGAKRGQGSEAVAAGGPGQPVGARAGETKEPVVPERGIVVTSFVSAAEIDPLYVEKSYFLEPGKPDAPGFKLLWRGLEASGQAAFGRAVLRTRATPVVVRPWGRIMVMHSLTAPGEVRQAGKLEPPRGRVRSKDQKLMLALIRLAAAPSFRSALGGEAAGQLEGERPESGRESRGGGETEPTELLTRTLEALSQPRP